MIERPNIRRAAGFTLIEIIVGLAIIGVLFALAAPVALRTIHTAKMSSVGYDCNITVRRAKSEAIRKNSPVVVRYDATFEVLMAFVDVHGLTIDDPPDNVFAPVTGVDALATDHEIARCALPAGVSWGGPADDPSIVLGFTTAGTEQVGIFEPDGTIQDIGSFRFGDTRGNYLAIQVAPTATARVTLLKWDAEVPKWRAQGEEGKKWEWF